MIRNPWLKVIVVMTLLIFAAVFIMVWRDTSNRKLLLYRLNPDVSSRVTDKMDNKTLVEYFNQDTNNLELVIQENGRVLWIEHPFGKVKLYKGKVDDNDIRFDRSRDGVLLVNGEAFLIRPLK